MSECVNFFWGEKLGACSRVVLVMKPLNKRYESETNPSAGLTY